MSRIVLIGLILGVIGGIAYAISFDPPVLIQKPVPAELDSFSKTIAISGNNIVVGAPYALNDRVRSGQAYLFDATLESPTFGQLLMTFANPIVKSGAMFGETVAVLDNQVVAVGAFNGDPNAEFSGLVFLFDGDPTSPTFGQLLKILENPMPPSDYDGFALSVAAIDNMIIVGAYGEDIGAPETGAVYLFDGDKSSENFGNLMLTITNPGKNSNSLFGWSVAGVGNNILVGAPDDEVVYLFDGDKTSSSFGQLLTYFENPSTAVYSGFANSIAGAGNNILIGAPYYLFEDFGSGIVYLYDGDPASATFGNLLTAIENPTPELENHESFGGSLTGSESYILIGDRSDDMLANSAGGAYLFDNNGSLLSIIENPSPEDYDYFGMGLAIKGDNPIVGAPNDNTSAYHAGTAYFYPVGEGETGSGGGGGNSGGGESGGEDEIETGEEAINACLDEISTLRNGVLRKIINKHAIGALVKILDDDVENDDAACGKLSAAINHIEAQGDKKIAKARGKKVITCLQLAISLIDACK